MSAFIVSDGTMDLVVSAILKVHERGAWEGILTASPTAGDEIGAKLYAMNHEAVRQRYDEREPFEPYSWQPAGYRQPVRWYKAIQCLRYQCSEGDVPETPLYAALTDLERHIAGNIVAQMPADEAAPWDCDRRDPRHTAAR